MSLFKKKGYPKYICTGNNIDTWEVDICIKKGTIHNLTTFTAIQEQDKWYIQIVHSNGRSSKRKLTTKLHNVSVSEKDRINQLKKQVAYREAYILATSELAKLKKDPNSVAKLL